MAIFNTVQNFLTLTLTRRLYAAHPHTSTSESRHPSASLSQTLFLLLFLVVVSRAYMVRPVTPLQARTFAVWTLTSAAIRFYAAYNITTKPYVPSIPSHPIPSFPLAARCSP